MATMTAEQFVEKWLKHWNVPWPDERAKQLVGDLRLLTGDELGPWEEDWMANTVTAQNERLRHD